MAKIITARKKRSHRQKSPGKAKLSRIRHVRNRLRPRRQPKEPEETPIRAATRWPDLIPQDEWTLYKTALDVIRRGGVPFMLGGGFAMASYTGHWRDTKDIDLYILAESRERVAKALAEVGFGDYYNQLAYDRGWIYRSSRDGVIVDLIWSMANRRAQVEESWWEYARSIQLHEESFQVLPVEELLWCKLYVFQRDHCDWLDVFNLLHAAGPTLDWQRLLDRVGEDFAMLKSAVTLFDWLSPNRAAQFPAKIRKVFQLHESNPVSEDEARRRVRLLDSRAWFAGFQPDHLPLEV